MNFALKLAGVTLAFLFNSGVEAALTKDQIDQALKNGAWRLLADEAEGMSIDDRRWVAEALLEKLQSNLKIPVKTPGQSSWGDALHLIDRLPKFANDREVADTLKDLVHYDDGDVRRAVFEVLSQSTGPFTTQLLVDEIPKLFAGLPREPWSNPTSESSRNNAILFFYALKGLLTSSEPTHQTVGQKYLREFRDIYANSVKGVATIKEVEEELTKLGAPISEAQTYGKGAGSHRIQGAPGKTAVPYQSDVQKESQLGREFVRWNSEGNHWIWIAAVMALLLLAGWCGASFLRKR